MEDLYFVVGNGGKICYPAAGPLAAQSQAETWQNEGYPDTVWKRYRLTEVNPNPTGNEVYESMSMEEVASAIFWLTTLQFHYHTLYWNERSPKVGRLKDSIAYSLGSLQDWVCSYLDLPPI